MSLLRDSIAEYKHIEKSISPYLDRLVKYEATGTAKHFRDFLEDTNATKGIVEFLTTHRIISVQAREGILAAMMAGRIIATRLRNKIIQEGNFPNET